MVLYISKKRFHILCIKCLIIVNLLRHWIFRQMYSSLVMIFKATHLTSSLKNSQICIYLKHNIL